MQNRDQNLFEKNPEDMQLHLTSFLNFTDKSKLFLASQTLFFQFNFSISPWQPELLAAGMTKANLQKIRFSNLPINWRHFSQALTRLPKTWCASVDDIWKVLCIHGNVAALKQAIELYGPIKFIPDEDGRDLRFYAAMSGNIAMLDELMQIAKQAGLPNDVRAKNQVSLLHMLSMSKLPNAVSMLRHCIEVLKMDPRQRDKLGRTLLHFAVIQPNDAVYRYLTDELGLSPVASDLTGKSLVHYAKSLSFDKAKAVAMIEKFADAGTLQQIKNAGTRRYR